MLQAVTTYRASDLGHTTTRTLHSNSTQTEPLLGKAGANHPMAMHGSQMLGLSCCHTPETMACTHPARHACQVHLEA